MRLMRFRRAFTLMELLITVVILSVVASVAVVGLQGYKDRVAMMADDTKMKVDAIALKMNAIDTGTVAGSLAELRSIDFERAYAQVMEEGHPYTMVAYLRETWDQLWGTSVAEAFVPCKYYNCDLKMLQCPKDNRILATGFRANGRPNGPISYAISKKFRNRPVEFFTDPVHANWPVLYESDNEDAEVYRHGNKSVRMTPAGKPLRKLITETDDPLSAPSN